MPCSSGLVLFAHFSSVNPSGCVSRLARTVGWGSTLAIIFQDGDSQEYPDDVGGCLADDFYARQEVSAVIIAVCCRACS